MGKAKKSTETKSRRTTAEYKVKKLTPRRIKLIKEFLNKTIECPPNNLGEIFGSEDGDYKQMAIAMWMETLIEFLREPKRCKSTLMDIVAWLKNKCFEELIEKLHRLAAEKKSQKESRSMEETPIDLCLGAIKTEMVDLKEEVAEDPRCELENFDEIAMMGGNQAEEMWGPSEIKEEIEMVTVKEELILDDDDEFEDRLFIKEDHLEEEISVEDQCLDYSLKRSPDSFFEEGDQAGNNQFVKVEERLGISYSNYYDEVSSEEIPVLIKAPSLPSSPPPTLEEDPESEEQKCKLIDGYTPTRRFRNELIKNETDMMIKVIQEERKKKKKDGDSSSIDWDALYGLLSFVQNLLKDVN